MSVALINKFSESTRPIPLFEIKGYDKELPNLTA